jgi:hypothetical protein
MVNAASAQYKIIYEQELQKLEQNDAWKKFSIDQQKEIQSQAGIIPISELRIGDEIALIRTLDKTSLADWQLKTQALPQQFSNAALTAARLLTPNTRNIRLSSNTLRTADDVKSWIGVTEQHLLEEIKNGPIMIS